jgi:hypothetical protein
MKYWIKRFAAIIAWCTFLIIFLCGIDPEDPLNEYAIFTALIKAFIGASLCWFTAFITGDILLKGVVEDIPQEGIDQLDGGIIQRIYDSKLEPQVKNVVSHEKKVPEKKSEKENKKE